MRILARRRIGLAADPWSRLHVDTADHRRIEQTVRAAVEARLLVSIAGARGGGKTHSTRRALAAAGATVVEPLRLTRERLHMGDVEWALVTELSDEPVRRSGEARSRQVRRVLGRRAQHGRVALLIDDAHTLHHQTLRALKRLRELEWLGASPLLGVVLLGQTDRTASIPEVGLRTDRLRLAGLSAGEALEALDAVLGASRIDGETARRLAGSARAGAWLDLIDLVDDCLTEAAARGEERITAQCAAAVLHPGAPAPAADIEMPAPSDGALDDALDALDVPQAAAV